MARTKQPRTSESAGVPNSMDIGMGELIPVVSLIDHPLNLLGQKANGRAKYRFEGFGEKKLIIYQDVLEIIENYRHFMNKGYFVILDERVLERHGLQELQRKNLSKEQIERILSGEADAVSLFKISSPDQRENLVGMLTRKLASEPNSVEANVVEEISRISKIDIRENAKDSRKLFTKKSKKQDEDEDSDEEE